MKGTFSKIIFTFGTVLYNLIKISCFDPLPLFKHRCLNSGNLVDQNS